MDVLQHFLSQVRFSARHLFSDKICGRSPTHYAGSVGYIHFFRGGKLRVLIDGEDDLELTKPSLVFFPGILPHNLHGDEVTGAHMLCAVVDSNTGMRRAVAAVLPRMLVIPVDEAPALHATIGLLIAEADARKPGWQLACDRLFEYLLAQIVRRAIEEGGVDAAALAGFGDPRLARSLAALNGDLKQHWTLDSLAVLAGMSRSNFASRFSAVMGLTPAEYILNLRLGAAKESLLRGVSAKAAAAEAGFASQPAFTRAFRRATGLAPLQWLEQVAAHR